METDQELELLRARVAHLESLVEKLTGARTPGRPDSSPAASSGLDRRRMLRNGLGLSAAAVAGVGMLDAVSSSAAADTGDAVTVGQSVAPSATTDPPTRIFNDSIDVHSSVLLQVDNATNHSIPTPTAGSRASIIATFSGGDHDGALDGAAIRGLTEGYTGVHGYSSGGSGVWGQSDGADGVTGTSPFGVGVSATSEQGTALKATAIHGDGLVVTSEGGYAVKATSNHDDAAILGIAPSGIGVLGTSGNFWGVVGQGPTGVRADGASLGVDSTSLNGIALSAKSGNNIGVTAQGGQIGIDASSHTGTAVKATSDGIAVHAGSTAGTALLAESDSTAVKGSSTQDVGVWGESGSGPGVRATSGSGVGLSATSTDSVGATFQGAAAAIRLVPRTSAGHPGSGQHHRGELVVDSAGALWLCTKGGTPGTWKQLAFA